MVRRKETTLATVPAVMASEGTRVRREMPSQEEVFRVRIRGTVVEDFMQTEEEEDFMEAVVMHREDRVTMALIGSSMSGGSKACLDQSLTCKEAWVTCRVPSIKQAANRGTQLWRSTQLLVQRREQQ
jgi:hypothetical protein